MSARSGAAGINSLSSVSRPDSILGRRRLHNNWIMTQARAASDLDARRDDIATRSTRLATNLQ